MRRAGARHTAESTNASARVSSVSEERRACDEALFFWLEDPYKDGGVSIFAHNKLRSLLKTPLLQTEHIFGLEQHVDFIVNGATDFVRTGVYEDAGITGAMKVAHAAEGFGLDVEFHGGGLAHRHCIASIRLFVYTQSSKSRPRSWDSTTGSYNGLSASTSFPLPSTIWFGVVGAKAAGCAFFSSAFCLLLSASVSSKLNPSSAAAFSGASASAKAGSDAILLCSSGSFSMSNARSSTSLNATYL
ncbi:TPA: hypothetical protein DCE37_06420 [Candidatus Latescibacteria bacterium]|nr:hypothetical protein [Candidatus Latescibacterota bacterium]